MPAIWTNPQTWELDDVFEANVANIQIRDNQLYLFDRPKSYVNNYYASDTLLPSLVWARWTDLDVTITITGTVIEFAMAVPIETTHKVEFDVYIPEINKWLSSGTSTQLTNGLCHRRSANSSYDANVNAHLIRDLTVSGSFTFQMWYKSGSATVVKIAANITNSVLVKEV